jgi:uncharacterized protein (UPF0264 family)
MTGLLVSVRDRQEAETALAGGADLLDLKEPAAGSLGAVAPAVMREVAEWLGGRKPLSVALGELATLDPKLPGLVPPQVRFAKLGLAGCARTPDWQNHWQHSCERLPPGVSPVAVVYADWAAAGAPTPQQVLAAACRLKAATESLDTLLIDTFHKHSGGLLDCWPRHALAHFVADVRCRGLKLVLAGSLNMETARAALELEPDLIAVRGAVCRTSRSGRLDPELVAHLRSILAGRPFEVEAATPRA